MTKTYRYKAFISYSHSDKAAAEQLLRSLEGYRVPRHLHGASSSGTVIPARVGTLFRDRDELPAAEDLTAEVKKALKDAEYMIVLCSPAAAASRWVNREIMEFKKLNGEGHLLSVILSGEPFASDKGAPEQECFPPALRYKLAQDGRLTSTPAEPLAADFRPMGDGYRRGVLKLVAGLLGVGLDTLVERDLQRKMRRVTMVTAASLVAMLGMGALTYEAVTARQEAEAARGEAEGLIEFMLTDLRDKLEPVGRLEVLDAVGDRIVKSYEEQRVGDMTPSAIGRRARSFHLLGEIENLKGDMDAAQSMFDQAAQSTEDLLSRTPNNTQRIYEHAQSVFWVGYQDWQRGNYEKAEQAFLNYKLLAEQLVATKPEKLDWQMELAYAHSNLGTLYLEQLGRPKDALSSFVFAENIFRTLSSRNPDDADLKLDLVDALGWIAETRSILGPLSEAKKIRTQQIEILSKMPIDAVVVTELLAAHVPLGIIEAEIGQKDATLFVLNKAVELGQELHLLDPTNVRWTISAAIANLTLSEILIAQEDLDSASQLLARARFYVSRISAATPISNRLRYSVLLPANVIDAKIAIKHSKYNIAQKSLMEVLNVFEQELEKILTWKNGPYLVASTYHAAAVAFPDQKDKFMQLLITYLTDQAIRLDVRSLSLLIDAHLAIDQADKAQGLTERLQFLKSPPAE